MSAGRYGDQRVSTGSHFLCDTNEMCGVTLHQQLPVCVTDVQSFLTDLC